MVLRVKAGVAVNKLNNPSIGAVVGLKEHRLWLPAHTGRTIREAREQLNGRSPKPKQALIIIANDGQGAITGGCQSEVNPFLQ